MLLPYTKITKLVKYQKVILSSKCLNTIFFSKFQCRGTIPFNNQQLLKQMGAMLFKSERFQSHQELHCVCVGPSGKSAKFLDLKFCFISANTVQLLCMVVANKYCRIFLHTIQYTWTPVFSVHGLHGCRMEYRFFASRTAGLYNFTSLQGKIR